MKLLIVLVFISLCYGSKDLYVKKKRGIFGEGQFLGGVQDLGTGIDLSSHQINNEPYLNNLEIGKCSYGIDLGSTFHQHQPYAVPVPQPYAVPVPQPYAVAIEKNIAVPLAHPVAGPVPKPYPVQIIKPYPVRLKKPYPVVVEKAVPYHINIPVRVPVAVPVPKPSIQKAIPYAVDEPVNVYEAVPVSVVKTPVVALGSGSLGYTHLGNGAYALGSGSLGITNLAINSAYNGVPKLW